MGAPPRTRTDKLAETLFQRSCDLAGGSCNPSVDDQYGWDFIFQLPAPSVEGPPDLGKAGLTGLAQIKSTRGAQARVTLKVSNALRMAQEDTPCFVVMMAFAGDAPEPHSAWVLHFWATEIALALKAARQAHVDGVPLHKATITLPLSEAARCGPLEIASRIEAEVAALGPAFAEQKARIRDKVGYEGGRGGGTVTFQADHAEEFIDMLLGRIPDLPVVKVDLREERFGLPGPALFPDQPARMGFEPKAFEPCQLILYRDSEELDLAGQVYVPHVPNLPEDLFKVWFKSRFLEVVWRLRGGQEVNAKFSAKDAHSIDALLELATMMAWLTDGEVELAIWTAKGQFTRGPVSLNARDHKPAWWEALRSILDNILKVLPVSRWPAETRLRLVDLVQAFDAIEAFANKVSAREAVLDLSGAPDRVNAQVSEIKHYFSPAFLQLKGVTLFAFTLAPVQFDEGSGKLGVHLDLGPPKLLQRGVLPGSLADNWTYLSSAYDALCAVQNSTTTLQVLLPSEPLSPRGI